MRSGSTAMPRSPLPQSPGGRLNSTWLEAVLLQPRRHHLRRMVIRPDIFDALEAGAGGRVEAVEEIVLGEEHRQVCGKSRHFFPTLIQHDDRRRRVLVLLGKFLELGDLVDLRAHRNVGHPFQDEFQHDRNLMLLHQALGLLEGPGEFLRPPHPDRLAAHGFRDRDMVDAVAGLRIVRAVLVLEGEADLEIHRKAALRLADQAEIGVVHDDMDVGQPVLRADRQFLDHELEIVVARQRDDVGIRPRRAHAERRRQRPAERAGLAAIDPVPRPVDMQELRAGDLAEARSW